MMRLLVVLKTKMLLVLHLDLLRLLLLLMEQWMVLLHARRLVC